MTEAQLNQLRRILGEGCLLTDEKSLRKGSQDFFGYSHILQKTLGDKLAEAVARIQSLEKLQTLVSYCYRENIGLTMRGAGTGNYGQAVPLEGGLVLDLSPLDTLYEIGEGVARVAAGVRCYDLENAARLQGWEMRVYPSTWVTATIGGFLAGGSAGIGSVRHGLLKQSGTVRSITVMTVEAEPRLVRLEGEACWPVMHAFGTNGILVEAEICLAPKMAWDQIVIAAEDFEALFAFALKCADDDGLNKRMLTLQQWPLPSFFVQIRNRLPEGQHILLADIAQEDLPDFRKTAESLGFSSHLHMPAHEPRKNPMLSNFAQNHTTLWAQKADPGLTYCAARFSAETWREQLRSVREAFGEAFYIRADFNKTEGVVGIGSGPIFPYVSDEDIRAKEEKLKEIGIFSYSVHDPYLDSAGRRLGIESKIAIKRDYDPASLCNPGRIHEETLIED